MYEKKIPSKWDFMVTIHCIHFISQFNPQQQQKFQFFIKY